MFAINRIIGICAVAAVLMASGCANYKAVALPAIPGTDTGGVSLLVNKDDGSARLTGQVRKKIDARIIEEYVREEFGYTNISNQITVE